MLDKNTNDMFLEGEKIISFYEDILAIRDENEVALRQQNILLRKRIKKGIEIIRNLFKEIKLNSFN